MIFLKYEFFLYVYKKYWSMLNINTLFSIVKLLLTNMHPIVKFLLFGIIHHFIFLLSVSGQEIALTFDDAPRRNEAYFTGAYRTEVLIKKIKDLDIKEVAFFCVPSRFSAQSRKRILAYAKAGHIIANHSYKHPRCSKTSTTAYIADIKRADKYLQNISGFKRWFRFPYLDEGDQITKRDSIRKALTDMQYRNGYVTVDTYEWYLNYLFEQALNQQQAVNYDLLRNIYINHIWKSIRFYDSLAIATLNRSPRHVLLLHENDLTTLFLTDLVTFIRNKGWTIISPTAAYNDSIAYIEPKSLYSYKGRVANLAHEKGIITDVSRQEEDTLYWKKYFIEKKVFK